MSVALRRVRQEDGMSSPTVTDDEPRTEAGRRLANTLAVGSRLSRDISFPNADDDITTIEAEARSAALTEVEEAVAGLTFDAGTSTKHYWENAIQRRVLAAITGLRR
jgi:3-hydroxy-3-methylglutaryl CoA synthase